MSIKIFLTFLVTIGFLVGNCTKNANKEKATQQNHYGDIEFEMPIISEPFIPDNEVNIVDFGAVSGGHILNSNAFADAIEAITKKGGGKVIIPAGIWLTGPIVLKSNLELFTEPGSVIIFSDNKDLYPLIETSFEGVDTWRCISPIYGNNLENVAFTGNGIWDGSGDAWRYVKKSKLNDSQWKKLVASGGVLNDKKNEWYPSEQFKNGMQNADQNIRHDLSTKEEFQNIRDFLRPVMVSIQNSKNVMFNGPVFQNSPAWCLHPLMIENLIVRNITVRNPWYSQNGDGLDIESCKNVIVENSSFDVGDDAICIKSGKDEDGRKRNVPCENLVIRNNIVYHGHGGVTVGSEMSGGVKNMHVSNCTFIGTDVGLRFKSTRGRGGIVENIFISDIRMIDIPTMAISFNLHYGGQSVSEMMEAGGMERDSQKVPVTEETPQFKNISIKKVTLKGALHAIFLQGLPEMNITNIEIGDMLLEADSGVTLIDADGIKIENIKLATNSESAINIFNCKNLELKEFDYNFNSQTNIKVDGSESENIKLHSLKNQNLREHTFLGDEVNKNVVSY